MGDNTGIHRIIGPTILLRSGLYFDFESPETSGFLLSDIAHGLAHICRFTGHCHTFYSVAEHSVHCSRIVPAEDAFAALMHDAAEAMMGDVSRPLKSLLPDYKRIEKRVEAAVLGRFGLPANLPASVKDADRRMLATEQRQAMGNADHWPGISYTDHGDEPRLLFLSPPDAFRAFMDRAEELTVEAVKEAANG